MPTAERTEYYQIRYQQRVAVLFPQRSNRNGGNEKYKELNRLDRAYYRKGKRCDICGYTHPPFKSQYIN